MDQERLFFLLSIIAVNLWELSFKKGKIGKSVYHFLPYQEKMRANARMIQVGSSEEMPSLDGGLEKIFSSTGNKNAWKNFSTVVGRMIKNQERYRWSDDFHGGSLYMYSSDFFF